MLRTVVFVLIGFSFVLAIVSCESKKTEQPREPSGLFSLIVQAPVEPPLTDGDWIKAASGGPMKLQRAELILDNDQAYLAKMNAVESARPGETVRMSYYIYTDDHSSARLWKLVEKKARDGVKFKILADFIANTTSMELFRWLASLPNVELRFFNAPSDLISRDVLYMSKRCEQDETPEWNQCEKQKWDQIDADPSLDFYSKLLLSGIYAREVDFLKAAVAFGAGLDLAELTSSGAQSSEKQKQQLVDFAKLVYQAKMKHDPIAMFKVMLAMKLYSKDLNPILNEITGRLPVIQPGSRSYGDWEHSTDFTHHKFLSVGFRFLQLGGRNIENSYHMEHNPLIHRYIFDDVDMAITVDPNEGAGFIRAYESLWNFEPMVMTWKDLKNRVLVDAIVERDAFDKTLAECSEKVREAGDRAHDSFENCAKQGLASVAAKDKLPEKLAKYREMLDSRAAEYEKNYDPNREPRHSWSEDLNDAIPAEDLKNARAYYVENLPFDKNQPADQRARTYGVNAGEDLKGGKYIHYVWDRALEKVCADNAKARREDPKATKRVVFHSAYYLPSAQQLRSFAKMMNGAWDCGGVDVVILTNSAQTTDMSWINFFSRYSMSAFYNVYSRRRELFPDAKNKQATFRYFDYVKQEGGNVSLHAKTTVFGDDIMVGSANGDVRSYYMDTNNALYLKNVPRVTRAYLARVDKLLKDKTRTTDRSAEFTHGGQTPEAVLAKYHREDRVLMMDLLKDNGIAAKLSPAMSEKAFEYLDKMTDFVYDGTFKLMLPVMITPEPGTQPREINMLSDKYNRVLQLM